MGYPYGKTYLEQIQEDEDEMKEIRSAYHTLRCKYVHDHPDVDEVSIPIDVEFALLGEAFGLMSRILDISDIYHFMWDVEDALLSKQKGLDKNDKQN